MTTIKSFVGGAEGIVMVPVNHFEPSTSAIPSCLRVSSLLKFVIPNWSANPKGLVFWSPWRDLSLSSSLARDRHSISLCLRPHLEMTGRPHMNKINQCLYGFWIGIYTDPTTFRRSALVMMPTTWPFFVTSTAGS